MAPTCFQNMQQRDFIKDEIERLGRAFGKLITMLLRTEGGDMDLQQRIMTVGQKLKKEIDLDPHDLVTLSRADLISKLDELNFEPAHFDQLGDVLFALADAETDKKIRIALYQRALLLFDLAGERSGTYSMLRADRETLVRAALQSL